MAAAKTDAAIVTATSYIATFPSLPGGPISFSELESINSKADVTGSVEGNGSMRTKQFGTTAPLQTVTLKRGFTVEGSKSLLAWHLLARRGDPSARSTGTLDLFDASGKKVIGYRLQDALCQELTINGVRAGDSSVQTIEVTIVCTEITIA